jgi:hypothetical protein
MVKVYAVGSPFEMKDLLKVYGYRWDAAAACGRGSFPRLTQTANVSGSPRSPTRQTLASCALTRGRRFSGEPGLIVVQQARRRKKR